MYKAIYADFDGCLSEEDPGVTLNIDMIRYIQEINLKSQKEEDIPFLAINSGRQQGFLESMAQTLGIKQFCIFESGAGIFRYLTPKIELYTDERISDSNIVDLLEISLAVTKQFGISRQANKEYSMSYIFPKNDPRIIEISDFIKNYILEKNIPYYVDSGINFVNINVKGVNKGTGLSMVAEKLNIKTSQIVGIGDSKGDWDFMKLCGFSACPQNASLDLKEKCEYISPYTTWKGTIDIIQKILAEEI